MKYLLAVIIMAVMVTPAFAVYAPTLIVDGRGNVVPQVYDVTNDAWLLDSGTVVNIDSITATVTTAPSTWSDSVTVRGTGTGGALTVSNAALTTQFCTAIIVDSTVKAIDLGDTYSELRFYCDTVAVLTFAPRDADPSASFGDIIADDWIPYVGVAIRYIKFTTYYTTTGVASRIFRVRAMK